LHRLITIATLAGLLIATSAAFAVTERLKLTKSAVYGTLVSRSFSSTCGCARGRAIVFFKLRRADDVTVTVLDAQGRQVAYLAAQHYRAGPVTLRWTGRDDTGRRVPDGLYRLQIHLANQHQTINLPNRIRLDTTPPQILSLEPSRRVFSPDGDGRRDFVTITYRLSEPGHVGLYLNGLRLLYSHARTAGKIEWFGTGPDGTKLPAGTYPLRVGATDLDGNATPAGKRRLLVLAIRYIRLTETSIVVRAGRPFRIRVATDAPHYAWSLGKRHGRATSNVLRVRAPTTRGRYTLTVIENGHASRAAVLVR
jgi:hypothetical protein